MMKFRRYENLDPSPYPIGKAPTNKTTFPGSKYYQFCELCNIRSSNQEHHRFPNTKANRHHYGKLIDEPFNKVYACDHCNPSHQNIPEGYSWDEKQFREAAIENRFELPEPMKSYKGGLS
jgi:hypothetical protein